MQDSRKNETKKYLLVDNSKAFYDYHLDNNWEICLVFQVFCTISKLDLGVQVIGRSFFNRVNFNYFTHLVNLVSPWGNTEELGLIGTNFLTLFASFVSFENALTSFWCIATPDSIVSRINSGFKYGKMGWWIRVMAPSDGWGIFCWDDWPTYNEFITCFHESWIYETWIYETMKFLFTLISFKWIFIR